MSTALSLEGVSKSYGAVKALHEVSIAVDAGEFVALLGPSGAGKSTVFRCLTALTRPDAGAAYVLGQRMTELKGRALGRARRGIGLIFQQHNLIGRLSVIDNVLAGRLDVTPTWRVMTRQFRQEDRQLALASLDRVGLLDKAYQRADTLSGGQQQRVAIARALTQEGSVILADEPIASLDTVSAEHVLASLRTIAHESGVGVLCSLHQVDLARKYADRLIGLRNGRVVFSCSAHQFDHAAREKLYVGTDAVPVVQALPPTKS